MYEDGAVRRLASPQASASAGLRAGQIGLSRGAVRAQAKSPAPASSSHKNQKSVITTRGLFGAGFGD
jgi:hypothetical protein